MATTKTTKRKTPKAKPKAKVKLAPIEFDEKPPEPTDGIVWGFKGGAGIAYDDKPPSPILPFITDERLKAITLTGSQLAYLYGLVASNVTAFYSRGLLERGEDGRYNLADSVRRYCAYLRDKREGGKSANNLDDQLKFWKAQKLKEQVRSWRVSRDREIALAILQQLRNPLQSLRERLRLVPNVGDELDALESALDSVDIETALDIVEGEDEGGDDD